MGSLSNRTLLVNNFLDLALYAGNRVVSAVGMKPPPFEGPASQGFVRGPDRPQRTHENGLAHVPAGTSSFDE
jgi:hypothetical protein